MGNRSLPGNQSETEEKRLPGNGGGWGSDCSFRALGVPVRPACQQRSLLGGRATLSKGGRGTLAPALPLAVVAGLRPLCRNPEAASGSPWAPQVGRGLPETGCSRLGPGGGMWGQQKRKGDTKSTKCLESRGRATGCRDDKKDDQDTAKGR